ncbi:hypothetical protein [Prosthecobacter dejongeii]|nr:hypothetical protein [Prosthecobacter dejongeii]
MTIAVAKMVEGGTCQSEGVPNTDTPSLLHFYHPEIAKELNPKQPDVTAALILYNLSLWQRNRYKQTLILGRRYCFRSLSQLQHDHPYFTQAAIHKALQRLEKKLGNDFLVRRDKSKLWFSIGDSIAEQLKASSGGKLGKLGKGTHLHSFSVSDAMATECVRSAVLLGNLKYALAHFTDPLRDAQGVPYAELSATKLSPILGFSEDTISRCLKAMCAQNIIAKHPARPCFHTLKSAGLLVDIQTAEVQTGPAEVHSQPADVHSAEASMLLEPPQNQGFQRVDETTYINEYINSDIKGHYRVAMTSSNDSEDRPLTGLRFLGDRAKEVIKTLRSSSLKNDQVYAPRLPSHVCGQQPELPYDEVLACTSAYEDLPYDLVTEDMLTDSQWIDEQIQEVLDAWARQEFSVDERDQKGLRQLFHDNPQLTAESLLELLSFCQPDPLFYREWKLKRGKYDPQFFLKQAKTPKLMLRYLPKIITQVYKRCENIEGRWQYEGDVEAPFDQLNFDYLGGEKVSAICSFRHPDKIDVEYVE